MYPKSDVSGVCATTGVSGVGCVKSQVCKWCILGFGNTNLVCVYPVHLEAREMTTF